MNTEHIIQLFNSYPICKIFKFRILCFYQHLKFCFNFPNSLFDLEILTCLCKFDFSNSDCPPTYCSLERFFGSQSLLFSFPPMSFLSSRPQIFRSSPPPNSHWSPSPPPPFHCLSAKGANTSNNSKPQSPVPTYRLAHPISPKLGHA